MSATDAQRLETAFSGVVRALGLLRPDTTPCGQPISITEAHAISELAVAGPLTQNEIADRLRLQKSTVSRLVDQLVDERLVKRTPNPADGRSVLVALTAKGTNRADRLGAARTALFENLMGGMSASDRKVVIAGLSRLEAAARDHV